jgi:hypothetical protein
MAGHKLTSPQDKTNNVIDLYKEITRAVEDLATCPYTPEAFSDLLGKIQAAVRTQHSRTVPMLIVAMCRSIA